MLENVYAGLNAEKLCKKACSKMCIEGLNARSKVYLAKVYFYKMYPTCVSSKLCEFILFLGMTLKLKTNTGRRFTILKLW